MQTSKDAFRVENQRALEKYLDGDLRKGVIFDMSVFSDGWVKHAWSCGDVGGAVGHAPFAGIEKSPAETWRAFAHRALCVGDGAEYQHLSVRDEFCWLFSAYWAETPYAGAKDAAERLRVVRMMRDAGLDLLPAAQAVGAHAAGQAAVFLSEDLADLF